MYFNFNPNLNTCTIHVYEDICKNDEVMQYCIERKKNQNTQTHHQACKHNKTCSCPEQHATFCALCFQFPSPTDNLFYFMNLLRKILEYFILHYLVLVHSCTQKNWKHSHTFPQWNLTKIKNTCKNPLNMQHHKTLCLYHPIPSDNLVWILGKRTFSVSKYLNNILYHKNVYARVLWKFHYTCS